MNDTKWRTVLNVVVARRIPCRIKLVFNDYAADAEPGGAVIVAYDVNGKPDLLRPEVVSQPTTGYWESGHIGPFRPRDIDWLEIATTTFEAIRPELPPNLKIVTSGTSTVILGYDVN
jgi:hypothetical protein